MEGKIISFQNTKGGVGKSCLARACALILCRMGYSVVIVDMGSQLSIYKGSKLEKKHPPIMDIKPLITNDETTFITVLEPLISQYEFIIVDTNSNISQVERDFVTRASDCVIVPLKSGDDDIMSTMDHLKAIEEIIAETKAPLLGLINMKDRTKEFRELRQFDGVSGLKVLKTEIRSLAKYKRLKVHLYPEQYRTETIDGVPKKIQDELYQFVTELLTYL